MIPAYRVPDLVGVPLIGWRVWRISRTDAGFRLLSLWRDEHWVAKRSLSAHCREEPEHDAPEELCRCGIYALKKRSQYAFRDILFFRPREHVVAVGRVSFWGKIIEGPHGYRFETAYPCDLVVVSRTGLPPSRNFADMAAKGLGEAYDIPSRTGHRWDWL